VPDANLPDPLFWLLAAGAISVALWNIGKLAHFLKLDVLMGRFLSTALEPLSDMLADRVQTQVDRSLRPLWEELRPNSGSSLRDAVDRTEADVASLRTDLREHVDSVDLHASDPTAHMRGTPPDAGGAGPR
jgi:hypothetical protein